MLTNDLNVVISQQDMLDIQTALDLIESKLPDHPNLPKDVRDAMLKINEANKVFAEDVVKEYPLMKDYVPPYFDVKNIQTDLALHDQVDGLRKQLASLVERCSDIQVIAGNEAFVASLVGFNANKQAAKRGMKNAVEVDGRLSVRWKKPPKPPKQQPGS
jgi:hypothetical protein